jgi:hypothetical protein
VAGVVLGMVLLGCEGDVREAVQGGARCRVVRGDEWCG